MTIVDHEAFTKQRGRFRARRYSAPTKSQ